MGTLRTGKHSRGGGLGVRDTPDYVATYGIRTVDGTKPSVRFAISSCHSGPEDPPNLVGIDRTCPNGRSPREPRQKFRAGAGSNPLGITKNRGSSAVHGEERHHSSRLVQKLPAKICLHFDLRLSALGSNSLAGNFRHYWSNLCTHVQ